ncbi:MAG TPA: class I SAM-dependent methyltransferase [Nocardioidaceae bacterium]|nr:class I SAM-dependent methyltransferase [Nocardioidaceae bacterium]
MTTRPARVSPQWLSLREPADACARAPELVRELRECLPANGGVTVHDLGSGTGSMARWLAAQLDGPQRWIMYDLDDALLGLATAHPPPEAADGAPVKLEVRRRDITRLSPEELSDADLVTASAVLDMMTADELDRLLVTCAGAECPVLIALSVTGQVDLTPADPFDQYVAEAFNAHQRRTTGTRSLLGPDAVRAAEEGFTRLGLDVVVRPSPWRLGAEHADLALEWLKGWLTAACEQRPELRDPAESYTRRRLAEAAAGRLSVTLHHQDLLARPR